MKKKKRKAHPKKAPGAPGLLFFKIFAACAAPLLVVLAVYIAYLFTEIGVRFSRRPWDIPSRFFSDSTLLYPGQRINKKSLLEKLHELGYREVARTPGITGEFQSGPEHIDIYLHDFPVPDTPRAAFAVRIAFTGKTIRAITDAETRKKLPLVELEPEEITQLSGTDRERRQPVTLTQIPDHLVDAVLTAEDNNYYLHPGINPLSILRALFVNLSHGSVVQGGSTITQQLVKNFFLTHEKTLHRKLKESLMALLIEARYTKNQILEFYLNEIYLGQKGSSSINGIAEASLFYFGRQPRELSLAESAAIAGIIKAPNYYSPFSSAARCQKRRDSILEAMRQAGLIAEKDFQAAVKTPVQTVRYLPARNKAPYFCDYLSEQLHAEYPPALLTSMGFTVYTTLDTLVQTAAENALERGLRQIEKQHPELRGDSQSPPLQGAILVVRPKPGAVIALAGGRDYGSSQFNRITQARRQPGSAIKPFVFYSALDIAHPATLLSNEQKAYTVGGKIWEPKNYEPVAEPQLTLRSSLARSVNLATIDLAMRVGLDTVISTVRSFAITTPLQPYPSLAIGAFEVIPAELARAYCTFAAEGALPQLLPLKKIFDENGRVIERRDAASRRIMSSEKAFVMNSLLRSVVTDGTARQLQSLGVTLPAAGKTGTTNDCRDAWFVGYTPDILCLVWVGFDDGRSIKSTGASAAVPIWADLMQAIPHCLSGSWYAKPAGVVELDLCTQSHARAGAHCPSRYTEVFLADKPPADYCGLHRKSGLLHTVIKGINRLFGR